MELLSKGQVAELPPYRAILIVDVKDFSGLRGRDHARLTDGIPKILQQTFRRCGMAELWEEVRFQFSTGDGYVLGFRAALLPYLINPFLPALQEELAYRNTVGPVAGHNQHLRMRVTIHVGPVTDTGEGLLSEGSGETRVEAHRLIDSGPVKDLLSRSSSVTCVAAIVSARAYADAVLSGYADDDPGLYVPAPVQVKRYDGTAYLRVPKPSGDLLTHGFRPTPEKVPDTIPAGPEAEQFNSIRDVSGTAVQARDYSDRHHGGIGDISGNNNTTFTNTHGPINTGAGGQYNGPQFNGGKVNYVAGDNSGTVENNADRRGRGRDVAP